MKKDKCADNIKVIGRITVSKYMVKKYGFEEAVKKTIKRKKVK